MSACKHMRYDAQVRVARIEDIGRFVAEVTIRCAECDTPVSVPRPATRLQLRRRRRCALDGLEADLPICPRGVQPTPLHGLMGYTVKGTN